MTDINEIKRELEVLTAKVAAYEAEKATKRNWPERIEAGMVFRVNGESMMVPNGKPASYLIALTGEKVGMSHYGWESAPGNEYLGHARDILTIRTDAHEPVEGIDERRQKYANASEYYAAARAPKAHEPTGAELVGTACEPTGVDLVGKRCRVSLSQIHHALDGVEATVIHYKNGFGYATEEGEGQRWTFARLAK